MDAVLGLDTSCYTTSAAAVDAQGKVIAFSRLLLPVEAGQRGLRQSEAVFAHVRQLPQVMESLMAELPATYLAEVRGYPGLESLDTDLKLNTPQLKISVNREQAVVVGSFALLGTRVLRAPVQRATMR